MKRYIMLIVLLLLISMTGRAQVKIDNADFQKKEESWIIADSLRHQINFEPKFGNNTMTIKLSSERPGIVFCSQKLENLTPGKSYLVRAIVKGENINSKDIIGANIGIKDTWFFSGAENTGTFDWKEIEFSFLAASDTAVLELRLGFRGNESTGSVWFDQVFIEELSMFVEESPKKYFRLHLPSHLISEDQYEAVINWLKNLDKAYEAYEELLGGIPYNGETIDIKATIQQLPRAWAWAGNPIMWTGKFVPAELKAITNENSWSFGILHEIAHNFSFNSEAYNWNEEMLANFRMYYVLEKFDAKANIAGKTRSYPEIKEFYRTLCSEFCPDHILYYVITVKEEVGWDAVKSAYRELRQLPPNNKDSYAKFRLFLETIAKHAERDANDLLSNEAYLKIKKYLNH